MTKTEAILTLTEYAKEYCEKAHIDFSKYKSKTVSKTVDPWDSSICTIYIIWESKTGATLDCWLEYQVNSDIIGYYQIILNI